MSTTGSDDTAADEREEVEPGRQYLPINQDGNRVFTSTLGPELDNFQHDTLDVIRDRAKWRPNLQPGVERPEIGHRQIRAPAAYWDPDQWDPEFKRQGRWVLPTGEKLSKTKGFQMKLIPIGVTGGDRNIKPLTRQNLLFWIDAVDKL